MSLALPVRLLATLAALFAWVFAGFGARVYLGGKAYLTRMYGDADMAQRAYGRLLGEGGGTLDVFGYDLGAWSLLALASLVLALALVLLVLLPANGLVALMGRKGDAVSLFQRYTAHAAAAGAATALLLLSVHPVLNLKSVPEGPRTFLNYAFEAAGYGWTNLLAYAGALGAATLFVWLGSSRVVASPPAVSSEEVSAAPKPEPEPEPEPDAAAP